MAKSFKQPLLIGLLALVPLFTACDRVTDISGFSEPVAASVVEGNGKAKVVKRTATIAATTYESDWVYPNRGATFSSGKYQMVVPKGALTRPTKFRFTPVGDVVAWSLEAFDDLGAPVTRFAIPLKLTIPYDDGDLSPSINGAPDFALVNIASESDLTILEIVTPVVNTKKKVITGEISHFSVWGLALYVSKELSPGID